METDPSGGNRYPSHWKVVAENADGKGSPVVQVGGKHYLIMGGDAHELEKTETGMTVTDRVVPVAALRHPPEQPRPEPAPQPRPAAPQEAPRPAQQHQPRRSDGTYAPRTQGGRKMRRPKILTGEYYGEPTGPHNIKRGWKAAGGAVGATLLLATGAGAIAFDGERASQGVGEGAELVGGVAGASAGGVVEVVREGASAAADGAGIELRSPVGFESESTIPNSEEPQATAPTYRGSETTVASSTTVASQPGNTLPVEAAHQTLYATAWGEVDPVSGSRLDSGNFIVKACYPALQNAPQTTLDSAYNVIAAQSPALGNGVHPGDEINCVAK